MVTVETIINRLEQYGVGPYICVPCSLLSPFINYVIDSHHLEYIKATSEGEAVGIASGASLAGRLPVVMMQNSGVGNIINPVTSLTNIYNIPMLFIVSLRGEPGIPDEPQHKIMGEVTRDILGTVGVESSVIPDDEKGIDDLISRAVSITKKELTPYALILKKGTVSDYKLKDIEDTLYLEGEIYEDKGTKYISMTRMQAIEEILNQLKGDEIIVSTTGMISRELYKLSDRENNFYTVGSMGCASAIAFGISLCKSDKKIIILDGDGAVLMKMGNLATIGHYQPKNIFHIVLDNESYDSTGGQATSSSTVNISKIAVSCGYRSGTTVYNKEFLTKTLNTGMQKSGPHIITVKVKRGHDKDLPRPTITPVEMKKRFVNFLEKG